jgi:hypothetical protein
MLLTHLVLIINREHDPYYEGEPGKINLERLYESLFELTELGILDLRKDALLRTQIFYSMCDTVELCR